MREWGRLGQIKASEESSEFVPPWFGYVRCYSLFRRICTSPAPLLNDCSLPLSGRFGPEHQWLRDTKPTRKWQANDTQMARITKRKAHQHQHHYHYHHHHHHYHHHHHHHHHHQVLDSIGLIQYGSKNTTKKWWFHAKPHEFHRFNAPPQAIATQEDTGQALVLVAKLLFWLPSNGWTMYNNYHPHDLFE